MVYGVPHGIATKAGARESLPRPNATPRRQSADARRGRDCTCTRTTTTACHSRRNLLLATPSVMAAFGLLAGPGTMPAEASLVRFPATELNNRYYLVRAGESKAEAAGYVLTNPVYKQGGGSDLSDLGRLQVESDTVERLDELQACEGACWIYPSITSCSYQTAELIAQTFGIGRNRIVPEYSFLDARGVGLLDNRPIEEVREQLRAGDSSSFVWRPPRGYDGTPNESVADVLTRVRQVLSITETQYSGQDVLFIAPDSDTLSTLQAAITGHDLRQHVGLAFRPGEVRAVQLDSSVVRDDAPVQFACPKPPNCW